MHLGKHCENVATWGQGSESTVKDLVGFRSGPLVVFVEKGPFLRGFRG